MVTIQKFEKSGTDISNFEGLYLLTKKDFIIQFFRYSEN